MARVEFSSLALADIAGILSDLNRNAGFPVVEKYRRNFDRLVLTNLSRFPEMCEARPQLGAHIRVGVVYPYLVVYRYRPQDDVVGVVRVLHGRRKITRALVNAS